MPKLISGYIARQVNKYLGKHVLAGTLIKVTPGTRGATLSAGTNPTTSTYTCKLWVSSYGDFEINGSSIKASDREISIIGKSIASGKVPEPNDQVIAEGVTYRIVGETDGGRGVKRDPDGAVYKCHARK